MRKISLSILALGLSVFWSASLTAQTPRATNRQIQTLLSRIETKTDTFRREVDLRLGENRRANRNIDESVTGYIADFETATDSLKSDFAGRRASASQVNDVLDRAWNIDDFMKRNRLGSSAENQWRSLRTDLDTLAGYYTVSWDWSRPNRGGTGNNNGRPGQGNWGGGSLDSRMTGTFTLNTSRSDNVNSILDRELSSFSTNDRDRFRRMLERRLASPEQLAIEKRGRTFTVASNLAQQVSVQTDNVAKTETTARGRTIRTTAAATNSGVTISTEGDRANDFWLSFEPEGNDRLRVTRRLYLENQNRTISSTSVYDKTSSVAQWPTVDSRPGWNNNTGRTDFHIPNGVQLTAVLRNRISTRASQIGDRFTMEVTSPSQYRGAVIEGRLAEVESSGRVSGRANIALEFDMLRMNGREYAFAGIIDSAREADGDVINLGNEGSVRDSNQTKKTVTRAGIGAAIGALIGAVAGGGSGAAIGAGVGAGAGAGSVLIQGRDNLDLEQGSTFQITASAPQNVGRNY